MKMEWISEKGASLTAFLVGLGFIIVSIVNIQYRYFFICLAICCLVYGYRQFKRRDSPFERHERELRRKRL
jgi:hypothetical protein